ncbi:MAG TPA: hypothetical protein V6D17_18600 [Candidatus Obscuribacterales bacterium]
MTSSDLVKTSPPPKSPQREWHSTATLVAASISGSLVIALYVFVVATVTTRHHEASTVEQAALLAADKLSRITVVHPAFGRVGLTDQASTPGMYGTNSQRGRVTGINSIYGTLSASWKISSGLSSDFFAHLVSEDFKLARRVESMLTRQLYASIEQRPAVSAFDESGEEALEEEETADNNRSILQDVTRMLSEDVRARGTSLIDVNLTLGSLDPAMAKSETTAPPEESEKEHMAGGAYRAAFPLSGPGGATVTFVPLLTKPGLIPLSSFRKCRPGMTPSAVMVEAVYESNVSGGEGGKEKIIKKACAAVGGKPGKTTPSSFVLRFPHGMPPLFKTPGDILYYRDWKSMGEWQQVVGTEVPGKGSLAPTIQPVIPGMYPGDALAVALYHWLKQIGPDVDANKFLSLLSQKWSSGKFVESQPPSSMINSCLAVDTGTREYAVLNQTNPEGAGQSGISHCFDIHGFGTPAEKLMPPSALPLIVNKAGRCCLAGREDFDQALVKDFLSSVYETNLASLESIEVGKQMVTRAKSMLTELDQKMFIERQELNSVLTRLNKLRSELPPAKDDISLFAQSVTPEQQRKFRQHQLAKGRLNTLKDLLIKDQAERLKYRKLQEIANRTILNATRGANSTFDLCAHSHQLLKDGLHRITEPAKGFLIGRRLVFFPRPVPIGESNLLLSIRERNDEEAQAEKKRRERSEHELISGWMDPSMRLLTECSDVLSSSRGRVSVEGRSLESFLSMPRNLQSWEPMTIVISSESLKQNSSRTLEKEPAAAGKNVPPFQILTRYPFGNMPLPAGQLLYYSRNTVKTGAAPEVCWSCVIRDLVASRTEGTFGEPLALAETPWFRAAAGDGHEIAGLAGEFQLRTPLPASELLMTGSYVTNPANNQQVPQIPAVPPDML